MQKFEQDAGRGEEIRGEDKTLKIVVKVEAAFKRFDQTGNEKLNFHEFSEMMSRKAESSKKVVARQERDESELQEPD